LGQTSQLIYSAIIPNTFGEAPEQIWWVVVWVTKRVKPV